MGLSYDLTSQFAKIVNSQQPTTKSESTVYGTAVEYDGKMYVKLDGSDRLTPVDTTADMLDGERVTVTIKNHTATVTGNISSPAARTDTVKELGNKISEFEIIVADKVSTSELEAESARIDTLVSENVTIREQLSAVSADIIDLEADNVTINEQLTAANASIENLKSTKIDAEVVEAEFVEVNGKLDANEADIRNLEADYGEFQELTAENFEAVNADISKLQAEKIDASVVEADYATIESLNATNAKISDLQATKIDAEIVKANYATIKSLDATNASIEELETNKLDAETAKITYANIDFSNIEQAAVTKIFTDSGIINDLVVEEGHITGELVGVTIKGDLIEGGTVVADKLVVKGSNGLYYKLNTDGVATEAEQTEYNSLSGSVITAKSITASKIHVTDLVAFGATIGGFQLTENSIYSGVKESVDNTTQGIYLDNTGQVAFGDADNFIKYFQDTDGTWKLAISADTVTIGSSKKTVETYVKEEVQSKIDSLELKDGEDATVLRIDSSRGTVFKNKNVSTVLTVAVYHGSYRITDIDTLHEVFGSTAYLEWSWQRLDENTFGVISATDSRISQDGFALTLSPDDVDVKVTFKCVLNV